MFWKFLSSKIVFYDIVLVSMFFFLVKAMLGVNQGSKKFCLIVRDKKISFWTSNFLTSLL